MNGISDLVHYYFAKKKRSVPAGWPVAFVKNKAKNVAQYILVKII
jgi:uncharacterized protein YbdZ (MbtH family)